MPITCHMAAPSSPKIYGIPVHESAFLPLLRRNIKIPVLPSHEKQTFLWGYLNTRSNSTMKSTFSSDLKNKEQKDRFVEFMCLRSSAHLKIPKGNRYARMSDSKTKQLHSDVVACGRLRLLLSKIHYPAAPWSEEQWRHEKYKAFYQVQCYHVLVQTTGITKFVIKTFRVCRDDAAGSVKNLIRIANVEYDLGQVNKLDVMNSDKMMMIVIIISIVTTLRPHQYTSQQNHVIHQAHITIRTALQLYFLLASAY